MEEPNHNAPLLVESSHIRALETIAMDTSQGQIFKFGFATVLTCNYVIYLKRRRMEPRGKLTVFATGGSSLPNPANEVCVQCEITEWIV
jgi:hypothetical protein